MTAGFRGSSSGIPASICTPVIRIEFLQLLRPQVYVNTYVEHTEAEEIIGMNIRSNLGITMWEGIRIGRLDDLILFYSENNIFLK